MSPGGPRRRGRSGGGRGAAGSVGGIETSIRDAIADLRAEGFDGDMEVDGGLVRCQPCGGRHLPSEATVERTVRVEGPTDPADESIVLGLVCRHCGGRGVLVTAYGPAATADEATVVTALLGPGR